MLTVVVLLCLTACVSDSRGHRVDGMHFPFRSRVNVNPFITLNQQKSAHENLHEFRHSFKNWHRNFEFLYRMPYRNFNIMKPHLPQRSYAFGINPWYTRLYRRPQSVLLFPRYPTEMTNVLHRYAKIPYTVHRRKVGSSFTASESATLTPVDVKPQNEPNTKFGEKEMLKVDTLPVIDTASVDQIELQNIRKLTLPTSFSADKLNISLDKTNFTLHGSAVKHTNNSSHNNLEENTQLNVSKLEENYNDNFSKSDSFSSSINMESTTEYSDVKRNTESNTLNPDNLSHENHSYSSEDVMVVNSSLTDILLKNASSSNNKHVLSSDNITIENTLIEKENYSHELISSTIAYKLFEQTDIAEVESKTDLENSSTKSVLDEQIHLTESSSESVYKSTKTGLSDKLTEQTGGTNVINKIYLEYSTVSSIANDHELLIDVTTNSYKLPNTDYNLSYTSNQQSNHSSILNKNYSENSTTKNVVNEHAHVTESLEDPIHELKKTDFSVQPTEKLETGEITGKIDFVNSSLNKMNLEEKKDNALELFTESPITTYYELTHIPDKSNEETGTINVLDKSNLESSTGKTVAGDYLRFTESSFADDLMKTDFFDTLNEPTENINIVNKIDLENSTAKNVVDDHLTESSSNSVPMLMKTDQTIKQLGMIDTVEMGNLENSMRNVADEYKHPTELPVLSMYKIPVTESIEQSDNISKINLDSPTTNNIVSEFLTGFTNSYYDTDLPDSTLSNVVTNYLETSDLPRHSTNKNTFDYVLSSTMKITDKNNSDDSKTKFSTGLDDIEYKEHLMTPTTIEASAEHDFIYLDPSTVSENIVAKNALQNSLTDIVENKTHVKDILKMYTVDDNIDRLKYVPATNTSLANETALDAFSRSTEVNANVDTSLKIPKTSTATYMFYEEPKSNLNLTGLTLKPIPNDHYAGILSGASLANRNEEGSYYFSADHNNNNTFDKTDFDVSKELNRSTVSSIADLFKLSTMKPSADAVNNLNSLFSSVDFTTDTYAKHLESTRLTMINREDEQKFYESLSVDHVDNAESTTTDTLLKNTGKESTLEDSKILTDVYPIERSTLIIATENKKTEIDSPTNTANRVDSDAIEKSSLEHITTGYSSSGLKMSEIYSIFDKPKSFKQNDSRSVSESNSLKYSSEDNSTYPEKLVDDHMFLSYHSSLDEFNTNLNLHTSTDSYVATLLMENNIREDATQQIPETTGNEKENIITSYHKNFTRVNNESINLSPKENAVEQTNYEEMLNLSNGSQTGFQNESTTKIINFKSPSLIEETTITNYLSVTSGILSNALNISDKSLQDIQTESVSKPLEYIILTDHPGSNYMEKIEASTSFEFIPTTGVTEFSNVNTKQGAGYISNNSVNILQSTAFNLTDMNTQDKSTLKSLGTNNLTNTMKNSLFRFNFLNNSDLWVQKLNSSLNEKHEDVNFSTAELNHHDIVNINNSFNDIEERTKIQDELESLLFKNYNVQKGIESHLKPVSTLPHTSLFSSEEKSDGLVIKNDWYDDSFEDWHKTEKKNLIRTLNHESKDANGLPKNSTLSMLIADYNYEDPYGDYFEPVAEVSEEKEHNAEEDVKFQGITDFFGINNPIKHTRRVMRSDRSVFSPKRNRFHKKDNSLYDLCLINIGSSAHELIRNKLFIECNTYQCCLRNITKQEIEKNKKLHDLIHLRKAILMKVPTKPKTIKNTSLSDDALLVNHSETYISESNYSNFLTGWPVFYNDSKMNESFVDKYNASFNRNASIADVIAAVKTLLSDRIAGNNGRRNDDPTRRATRKKRHSTNRKLNAASEKPTTDNTSLKQVDAAAMLALLKQNSEGTIQGDDAYAGDDQYSYEYGYDESTGEELKAIDHISDEEHDKGFGDDYDDGSSILELISTNVTRKHVNRRNVV